MKEALSRLEAAFVTSGDPILDCLRPPLSVRELDACEETFGAPIPSEVREWFSWHDGLAADRAFDYWLVPLGLPLGLEEALSMAAAEREVAERCATEFGLDEPLWHPGWLPLFHDRADLLVVRCPPERAASSPVWFRMSQEPEAELAYDSLQGLVGYAAECWESGAFTRTDVGTIGEERERLPEIWRRWNPVAYERNGGVPPMAVMDSPEPEPEPDIPFLLERLTSDDEVERLEAVDRLARAGHQAALGPGVRFLRHPAAAVRWSAAQSLGRLRDPAAISHLVQALGDEVDTVRILAADALAAFGETAGPEARRALARLAELDPDETVRRIAVDALRRLET